MFIIAAPLRMNQVIFRQYFSHNFTTIVLMSARVLRSRGLHWEPVARGPKGPLRYRTSSTPKCKAPLVRAGLQIVGQIGGPAYGSSDAVFGPAAWDWTDEAEDRNRSLAESEAVGLRSTNRLSINISCFLSFLLI